MEVSARREPRPAWIAGALRAVLGLALLAGGVAQAQTYSVLKSFGGVNNQSGAYPDGVVQAPDGTLYGTSAGTSANIDGNLFKILPDGTGFTVLLSFTNSDGRCYGLTLSGSTLYGVANGGSNGYGKLIKVNTDGSGYAVLKHCIYEEGGFPRPGLTVSGNVLYGTSSGGTNGEGTVFKMNTDGTDYTVLKHFAVTNGANPNGGLVVSGNVLYGTTQDGGTSGQGTVFSVNTDGTDFTVLKQFSNAQPGAGLTLSGNVLYGTTSHGSANNAGTVFKINTDGTGYGVLKNFSALQVFYPTPGVLVFTNSDGGLPRTRLALSGDTLYGSTSVGGSGGRGTLFKIFTEGTGFTVIREFTDSDASASAPTVWGNTLFATTYRGGFGYGTVFRVNTDGTGYKMLQKFPGSDGESPSGDLTLSGNVLYGTTRAGGATPGYGTVFKVSTDGTGHTVLKVCNEADGYYPKGSLTLSGNVLYGTMSQGGALGYGTVFKVNTDGTGYTVLKALPADGTYPNGSLTLSGSVLYGTTYGGGSNSYGSVFSVNTDGTSYTVLKHFNVFDGGPVAGMALSGGVLYGTTYGSGIASVGTIFSINTDGTGYTVLKQLTFSDGQNPFASLALSGNVLYGTTASGGSGGNGTVFKVNTDGTGFFVLKRLNGVSDGAYPRAGLTLSGNVLYGTTRSGGSSNAGTVFKLNTDGSGFRVIQNLAPGLGENPESGVQVAGGVIYGTTYSGGPGGAGVVFRIREQNPGQFNGMVAVQIIPPTSVAAGARWRVEGGAWLDSGALATNVPVGSRVVEFKPASGWITPQSVTVRVIGNHTVSNAASYLPLASVNAGPITFSNTPAGPLPEADSGKYLQADTISVHAPEPFNNLVRATRSIRVGGKTVIFQAGHANGLYEAYNENDDLKELSIHAETLIVRSPLRLPQTAVALHARELRFEGAEARIDTTPRSLTARPAGATFSTPAANGADGFAAGDVDVDVELFTSAPVGPVRFIMNGGSGQPCGLGLNGNSGANRPTYGSYYDCPNPNNTTAAKRVESHYVCDLLLGCFPFWYYREVWYWPTEGFFDDPETWKPTDGTSARPGGKPGNGGEGGRLSGPLGLIDHTLSKGGASASTTHNAGGKPGTPQPAYKARDVQDVHHNELLGIPVSQTTVNNWYGALEGEVVIGGNVPYPVIHISQPGQSADSPAADFELGPEGTFPTAGHALSWLSPFALRPVLSHVKDAMLNGNLAAADSVLAEYQTLLASYPSFPEWQEVAVEWRTEFAALLLEIQSLRQSIVRHPASVGSAITLTASGSGSPPLRYKWLLNGALVAGATNASLSVPALASASQGNYQVVVSNSFGSVTSSVAVVTAIHQLSGALLGNGAMRLSLTGVPGIGYDMERAAELTPSAWQSQQTKTAAFDGLLIFTNAPVPATNNFWRIRAGVELPFNP